MLARRRSAGVVAMGVAVGAQPVAGVLVGAGHCPACWRSGGAAEGLGGSRGWWVEPGCECASAESRTVRVVRGIAVRVRRKRLGAGAWREPCLTPGHPRGPA